MTNDQYQKIPAISRSQIANVLISDKHYLEDSFKGNASTDIGSLFHDKVLGTNEVKVLNFDGFGWRSVAHKVQIARYISDFFGEEYKGSSLKSDVLDWVRERGGCIPTPKELSDIESWVKCMKDKDYKGGSVFDLFSGGTAEQVFISTCTGKKIKCMSDYWREEDGKAVVYDLKTIKDVSDRTIRNSIVDRGYDIQCAMYSFIMEKRLKMEVDFKFVFVGKGDPSDCRVITLDEETKAEGLAKMHKGIERIKSIKADKSYQPVGLEHDDNFNAVGWSPVEIEVEI